MNTDGNTDAINRHLADREEYDLHKSMVDDIEALRDKVKTLEAQRNELIEALEVPVLLIERAGMYDVQDMKSAIVKAKGQL